MSENILVLELQWKTVCVYVTVGVKMNFNRLYYFARFISFSLSVCVYHGFSTIFLSFLHFIVPSLLSNLPFPLAHFQCRLKSVVFFLLLKIELYSLSFTFVNSARKLKQFKILLSFLHRTLNDNDFSHSVCSKHE